MTSYLLDLARSLLPHRRERPAVAAPHRSAPVSGWSDEDIAALSGMVIDLNGKTYPLTIYRPDGSPLAILRNDGRVEPAAR